LLISIRAEESDLWNETLLRRKNQCRAGNVGHAENSKKVSIFQGKQKWGENSLFRRMEYPRGAKGGEGRLGRVGNVSDSRRVGTAGKSGCRIRQGEEGGGGV